MNTQHTPGPWWLAHSGVENYYVAGVGDAELTDCIRRPDAALIAAAPDLLAALHAMLATVYDEERDDATVTAVAAARAAIARATGADALAKYAPAGGEYAPARNGYTPGA